MQTLWQRWTKKEEPVKAEETPSIHNELGYKIGQIVSLDVLDFRGNDYVIERIEEHLRRIGTEWFYSTDYVLSAAFKLRVCDKKVWLLHLKDEFAFEEGFMTVVKDAMKSTFTVDEENAEFIPVSCTTIQITNDLGDKQRIQQWTFSRTAKDEANQEFQEVLFVEQCEEKGWFQLWRGVEIATTHILVI